MSKGWIKIDRSIMEHWIFQDAEYFRAWILIILMANHEDATVLIDKQPVVIPRGAFHSSVMIMSRKFAWSKNRTLKFLKTLENEKMLTTKRTARGTTFFVENYGKYQDRRDTLGTADGTPDGTADRTADGTQTRMIKNNKEWRRNARARDTSIQSKIDEVLADE